MEAAKDTFNDVSARAAAGAEEGDECDSSHKLGVAAALVADLHQLVLQMAEGKLSGGDEQRSVLERAKGFEHQMASEKEGHHQCSSEFFSMDDRDSGVANPAASTDDNSDSVDAAAAKRKAANAILDLAPDERHEQNVLRIIEEFGELQRKSRRIE